MRDKSSVTLPTPRVMLRKKYRSFPPHLAPASFFVLVFAFGTVAYTLLSPSFSGLTYPPADRRLALLYAVPSTAEGVLRLLFFASAEDGILFSLIFLFSFSFFTPLLVHTLLAVRALRLSVLLCRLHDMTRLGALSPSSLVALVTLEAIVCALTIHFSTRAVAVSQSLRSCSRYEALPIFILLFSHTLRLFFIYFATLISAGLLYLFVRL